MRFYTRIDQDNIVFLYSHSEETMYVFPEIKSPKKMSQQAFFRRLAEGRKIAKNNNIPFKINQYCV